MPGGRGRPRAQHPRLRVPGRVRHRAHGFGERDLRGAAGDGRPAPDARRAAHRARGAGGEATRPAARGRPRGQAGGLVKLLFDNIDQPGLAEIDTYQDRGGYGQLRRALDMPAEAVLHELELSGLRGRGGAGFAMGKKAAFLPKGDVVKYLVCNADESEPGAFKDRELMQKSPHQLIEGL